MKIFLNLTQKNSVASTIILLACSFTLSLACSSGGGGSDSPAEVLPSAPTGLYLRPEGEDNLRVYSGGDSTIENSDGTETRNFDTLDRGLLDADENGSSTAIPIGTFGHDDYVPGTVADAEDGAGDGDDISISYSYSLAADAGDDYSNNLFDISENVLSFTGSDSAPPYTLNIETTRIVTITLASDFNGRINADASGDAADADTRKFAFDGGELSKADTAKRTDGAVATGTFALDGTDYITFTAKDNGTVGNITLRVTYDSSATAASALIYDAANSMLIFTYNSGSLKVSELHTALHAAEATDLDTDTFGTQSFTSLFDTAQAGSGYSTKILGTASIADTVFSGGQDDSPAYRTVTVAEGEIYMADTAAGTGKIISFAETDLRLPDTAGIYEYHVIVTDENSDGTGEVSAVVALPTDGTEFYVLGTTEVLSVPNSITLDGIKFTDKAGGPDALDIKIIFFYLGSGPDVVVDVINGDTITITAGGSDVFVLTYTKLFQALMDNDKVAALVDVTTVDGYEPTDRFIDGDIAKIKLSGGTDGASATKAQVKIGDLIIEASTAGAAGNGLTLTAGALPIGDSGISHSGASASARGYVIEFSNDQTLQNLIDYIDNTPTLNEVFSYDRTGISQDTLDNTLLKDVFPLNRLVKEDGTFGGDVGDIAGADPVVNLTGEPRSGTTDPAWITFGDKIINTVDYIIKLYKEIKKSI